MFYKALEKKLQQYPSTVWDGGLVKIGRGHTAEANKHEFCHCTRTSTAWYAALVIGGMMEEDKGLETLNAILSLQDRDKSSRFYGCTRWYAEETRIADTNAAFFSQLPLLTVMLFDRERVPERHQAVIREIFSAATEWYKHEVVTPSVYYSNKIVSDGAMLLGTAKIASNAEAFEAGLGFFERWLDYTEKDGWGWGENMSAGYNTVIFASLKTALLSLGDSERERSIAKRIEAVMEGQKDLFKYFKGYEFTPAIRNYNFGGSSRRRDMVSRISVCASDAAALAGFNIWDFITFAYLFRDEFMEKAPLVEDKDIDIRHTKVYKDAVAYSCVMRNGSIGSMNKFPVIPGSYQHKSWGLGWQCMPINFVVYNGEVGYLRRIVRNEKETVYQPKHAYLSPCLFSDFPYPEVLTRAKQEKNVVIAKRSIEKIHNMVGELSDELYVPSFSGKCEKLTVGGREWAVISYENVTVFVSSTLGFTCPEGSLAESEDTLRRTAVPLQITCEKDLSVKQTAFKRDEVALLRCERVELGWIMIYEDKKIEDPEKYLSDVTVTERSYNDGFQPRVSAYSLHGIEVKKDNGTLLEYQYDPYI